MLISWYNDSSVSYEFVKKQFEVGKSTYYITITATYTHLGTTYTQKAKWQLTSNAGDLHIPALRIARTTPDSTGIICEFTSASPNIAGSGTIRLGATSGVFTGISTINLIENTGSGSRLSIGNIYMTGNISNPSPNIVSFSIDSEIPIFIPEYDIVDSEFYVGQCISIKNLSACDSKITNVTTGDKTKINEAVNFYSVVNEIPINQVWSVRCNLKKNGSFVSGTNKAYDFRIQPNSKIAFYIEDRINGDGSANAILQISNSPWLQKNAYAPDSTYVETSILDSTYWSGNWQDYDTGDSYTGIFSTNIPCYRTAQEVQDYFDGKIGIDEAINGGDCTFSRSTIGDDLTESDIPTVNLAVSGCGSYMYALSSSDLKDIMSNYVYTDDSTLQNHIKDGLWLWGNNPADFIIDCYYIPFDISNFYDTITAGLKFGTYLIPDTSYSAIKEANGTRITLFNTTFEGIYGDWRDYTQFDYDLYLPFVSGFLKLDTQKYLNKTVKCEMMFDITTHNIRYYIFADGIITDRVDGSVGINMPLMATDTVNKAKADRNATLGAVQTGVNTATGLLSAGAKVVSGDVVGGIGSGISSATNGVIGEIKAYDTLASKPTESVQGAFSSSMNIYDITYAYLRITERAIVLPDKVNTLYGYPSYYMGKASALSGYCEISDVRLVGFTGTKDEANALKNALKEGVIL